VRGGAPGTARCSPVTSAGPGAPLTLWADMNQMHLMDPESGRVI
jgi:hypothetical protein